MEPLFSQVQAPMPGLKDLRTKAIASIRSLRQDHKRALNPTPYKVGEI